MTINSLEALRAHYPAPQERSLKKQLTALDPHCIKFISLSPFVVIASGGDENNLDASPRGGVPGFIKVVDQQTLLIPDSVGNNRLDTLSNILSNGKLGLLFLIPGIDETLRVNGTASLSNDTDLIVLAQSERKPPRLVIKVSVHEAYLHCAKAFMRSKLWDASSQVERDVLPSMGQMLTDQVGIPLESQEDMLARYRGQL